VSVGPVTAALEKLYPCLSHLHELCDKKPGDTKKDVYIEFHYIPVDKDVQCPKRGRQGWEGT
jgi:hypothetical protein